MSIPLSSLLFSSTLHCFPYSSSHTFSRECKIALFIYIYNNFLISLFIYNNCGKPKIQENYGVRQIHLGRPRAVHHDIPVTKTHNMDAWGWFFVCWFSTLGQTKTACCSGLKIRKNHPARHRSIYQNLVPTDSIFSLPNVGKAGWPVLFSW
jgi:hypothetical protein